MSEPSVPASVPAASDLELRKNEVIRKLAAHLPDDDDADFIRLKKLNIVEKLLASLEDPNMNPFHLNEIESFHSHPPLRPAPAFLDDVNQRLQLLRDIKSTTMKREDDSSLPWQCLPAAFITINVWAAFIAAPIEALQALLGRMKNGEMLYEHLREGLKSIECNLPTIIQINLGGQLPSQPPASQSSQSSGPQASPSISSTLRCSTGTHVAYNLTSTAISHVSVYCSKLSCLGSIWGWARIERYQRQHGYDEHKEIVTDRPSSMIFFDSTVQHRWKKTQIAFEPVQKPDDHTVRVRLHLLQDTKLRCTWDGQRPGERQDTFQWRNDLATDPRKFLDPFVNDKSVTEGPLEIRVGSSVTQHIVRDGYVFDITSEDPALLPNYDVLDLQYRIELMAALVGAGEGCGDTVSSSTTEWEGDLSLASGYSHEDF
ncbi:hypothetical protein CH063_02725 [Colletotrichum higginsianum]|uniref:Uncharacterized protein n=1 Tax=Colletotrichum higginsianum (strain IMI 349063) TaxID=759273 RepID=H1VP23_COLHI|nr:hypothetical protein CH63R_11523 [Colletotrichum higginsianum IMI 349063]OBR04820.1 hypothetical protein CH63R_11523 [Colletotrichum higginsianum IMI 349063]CCF41977.1 hypothetical protein CH063_02725 [Colletotrichum higginsianum]